MDSYKHVAALIIKVLTSRISLQDALIQFPADYSKDINLKSAFDALVHYEADEDIRKNDPEYAQLQNDYLEFIASVLFKHGTLPNDVIKRYYNFHKDNFISDNKKNVCGFINYIKRMISF